MNERVHFIDSYLLHPTNPVIVNLIGAGGTGSQVFAALAKTNYCLIELGHPGLFVRLFDSDLVSEANIGRQLFTRPEIGMNKSVALVNRYNRVYGTNWKAVPMNYSCSNLKKIEKQTSANITVTCVDSVEARFEIAEILDSDKTNRSNDVSRPIYWVDFGNSRYTGQAILATIGNVRQPDSKKYSVVSNLPFVTKEYKELLNNAKSDNTPSCSLEEALTKQDLFINASLAQLGATLLKQLFTEVMITYKGFFLNLLEFRTQPIPV